MSDEKIQELEQEVKKLKEKLKKRYGLIWEDKPEQFDKDSENALPILKDKNNPKYPNINTGVKNGKAPHILIEGDNYHTLSVLNYTHKGKIDLIYIDPPYNTGNKDFIYNDKFVDKEDEFKHSKWLSFMSKRLKLAKDLLTDDGVIFISIDDNEQAQLKLLCDEVFTGFNFVGTLIWKRAKGGGNAKGIVKGHDYILVYSQQPKTLIKEKSIQKNIVIRSGKQFIKNDDFLRKVFGKYDRNIERRCLYEEIESIKGLSKKIEIDKGIEQGIYELSQYKNTNKNIVCRLEPLETAVSTFYSIIDGCLSEVGKNDLSKIEMDELFEYPKPVVLIEKILNSILKFNKNATILDFFAGSGTTGHAVLELNKTDGGNRQFILSTNNENGICENITYERIKRVMQGYTTPKGKEVEGLGGELQYLKTDFIKKDNNLDDLRLSIVNASTTILCCKESIFTTVLDNYQHNKFKIFKDDNKYLCILFGEFLPNLQVFYDEFKKFKYNKVIIYAFVSDVEHLSTELKNIDSDIDFHIKEIPDELLATYNEIFGL
jgi:adenine-specific DNA-methyltransferase